MVGFFGRGGKKSKKSKKIIIFLTLSFTLPSSLAPKLLLCTGTMAATCDAVSPAAALEEAAAAAAGAPPAVVRETALKTVGPKWAGKTPGFSL